LPIPADEPDLSSDSRKRKKPARLKMHYRTIDAFLVEYRENLRRGGTFIKTSSPLPIGRDCVFEITAPGLDKALSFEGVVTWSSKDGIERSGQQEEGMGIEYRMTERARTDIERILDRLSG